MKVTVECAKCGNINTSDLKTCAKCGAPLDLGSGSPKQKTKKRLNFPYWILVLMGILAGFYYYFFIYRLSQPEPKPQSTTTAITYNSRDFFKSVRESFRFVIAGKKYYLSALQKLNGTESVPAETLPDSTQERFSGAAEDAALALENFQLAQKKLKDHKTMGLSDVYKDCEKDFYTANDKYLEAAKILSENAKGHMLADEKKINSNLLPDAAAKFGTAESLMTAFLMSGCQGDFLKYIRSLNPEDKGLVYIEYKNFFGEKFSTHQAQLSLIIGYTPPAAEPPK